MHQDLPGMLELNLHLLFTNISFGPVNELCATSLTRNVTDYTLERHNRACGIGLWNNFTGVNNRGRQEEFQAREGNSEMSYSNTCWQVAFFTLFALCVTEPPHWSPPLKTEMSRGNE